MFDRRAIPAHAVETRWHARDGHAIRRIDWPGARADAPRGSILFLPGRGDYYEKYLETLDYWHQKGWRVTASDWRWQAGSGRYGNNPLAGDVSDFSVWVDDLATLWEQWVQETPGPHVIAGHSMGGHLVLRAIAEKRINPVAGLLSAPMLGFINPLPLAWQQRLGRFMCRIGDPGRMAWKSSEKPGASVHGRQNLLTHDDARYADEVWWREHRPDLAMGPGTWRWAERGADSIARLSAPGVLEAVQVPLLILATRFDALVAWKPIEQAAARLPHAELVAFGREAAHEILREEDGVRERALAAIDSFLDRAAPGAQG
ncbi:alpha/beta fold hydrolase [Novosphingobium cyanobacteriorum]|uniref:Alpha/beta hydrolase n=1 Tax=Novosphingobium cyanobacteriorum TaxID=3024215 RepID=A0ABT6CFB7_9SPHN|nr:alpha/beta hydrolase [Novosphingobium cyanobacteriorum]MDF8332476.1 alpha/beta hydrolase [Novosphingobium cyanobacteriorum]